MGIAETQVEIEKINQQLASLNPRSLKPGIVNPRRDLKKRKRCFENELDSLKASGVDVCNRRNEIITYLQSMLRCAEDYVVPKDNKFLVDNNRRIISAYKAVLRRVKEGVGHD